jgi:AraC-like DNA-binding protein
MNLKKYLSILLIIILVGAVYAAAMPTIASNNGKGKEQGEDPELDVEDCDYVNTPFFIKEYAIQVLKEAKTGEKKVDRDLDRAICYIRKSLNRHPNNPQKDWKKFPLWENYDHLDEQHGHMVFNEERKAVNHMLKGIKLMNERIYEIMQNCEELSEDDLAELFALKQAIIIFEVVIMKLVLADKILAEVAIQDAEDTSIVNPKKDSKVKHHLKIATNYLERAKKDMTENNPDKAINDYKCAWHHAQLAIKHAQKP